MAKWRDINTPRMRAGESPFAGGVIVHPYGVTLSQPLGNTVALVPVALDRLRITKVKQ